MKKFEQELRLFWKDSIKRTGGPKVCHLDIAKSRLTIYNISLHQYPYFRARAPAGPPKKGSQPIMSIRKRLIAALLAVCLVAGLLPAAGAAGTSAGTSSVKGSISATLRMDYDQNLDELEQRKIQATLTKDGKEVVSVPLYKEQDTSRYQVSMRNRDGGPLGNDVWPAYIDLTIEDLEPGTYTLKLTGEGYVTYTKELKLSEYSLHVTLGTGDATLSLGDVNGDGKIDTKDQEALSEKLGSEAPSDLEKYDLNGDGAIDIVDLAYITRQLNAAKNEGDAVLETVLLAPPLDERSSEAELGLSGTELFEGTLAGMMAGSAAKFHNDKGTPVSENSPLTIPVILTTAVETGQLQIVTPDQTGEILKGTVMVMDEKGNEEEFPFDNSLPEGIHGITRTPGTNVITISLGKRVAVKRITVSVTKTEGGQVAIVESIQFLKDIVPENPVAPNSTIRNLTAEAGRQRVTLTWTALPNISGYKVSYRPANQDNVQWQDQRTGTNRVEISGLEDPVPYEFTVTPIDGAWEGKPSAPVLATPLPGGRPDAPDMVSITALDGALSISWKTNKDASYYEVYYTTQENAPTSSYTQAGGTLTEPRLLLENLTNGTDYYIYVVAGNDLGKSGPSQIHKGTPKAVDYSWPKGIPENALKYSNSDNNVIEKVYLTDPNNVSPSSYTQANPFKEENMADGDLKTHWTSHSYGDGNWWDNKQVQCIFKEPQDLSAVIWIPRLDGSYPSNLRTYTITVWTDGQDINGAGTVIVPNPLQEGATGNVNEWPGVKGNPVENRFAVLPFEPVKNVKKIAITIEQVGYAAVSLAEICFLPYDEGKQLDKEISGLFTNELCTELRGGVTETEIDELEQRLKTESVYYLYPETMQDELALARELLKNENSGVVIEGIESRDTSQDSKYQQGGSGLQPLGAAAKAGQEITVYAAGIPAGETVTLYATQFNAEASTWQAKIGTLQNGRNVLTVPQIGSSTTTQRGGSLYLTYGGKNPDGIKLHVRRAVDIPMLDVADWYSKENSEATLRERIRTYVVELNAYVGKQGITSSNSLTNCLNVTEISTPTVLLSLPAAAVAGANSTNQKTVEGQVETIYNSILAWEDVMHICKTTQGIDKTYGENDMHSRQNIRCMTMFSGAFMYAAGNHIGIGYGSCGGMVTGRPISQLNGAQANSLFGWGIAHEIGHNMDKLGRAEITNNIYSLMVQTYDGENNILKSRLETSNKYEQIFNKTAQGYPGASNNVFVQLGMYWQLHLAYDGAKGDEHGPMWFFNQFFKDWKAGTYYKEFPNASYDEKVALTAAGVTGKNLNEFFLRWGMTLSDEVQAKLNGYADEDRAIWYLSDESRRERLNGTANATGSVAVSAKLNDKNEIVLTITPTISGKIQGYEIRRNGETIAFTTGTTDLTSELTYTDNVGAANHRTYEYTVAVYDILGKQVAEGKSGQVRVAYDDLVDTSAYTVKRSENGDVVFTFDKPTPVTGMKLEASPASGSYKVTIEAEFTDGESGNTEVRTATARSGDFSTGNLAEDSTEYLAYFRKPGAETDDARIWTYDARTVTITGIPSDMPLTQVRLVSYAGDDIAFYGSSLTYEGGTLVPAVGCVGRLASELDVGDRILPAGTLVVVGTYRGDPVFCTIKIKGRFVADPVKDNDASKEETEDRYISGDTYLFAEIPADGAVSDIENGIFVFVPNVQQEAELQGKGEHDPSNCSGVNLLPSQMQAEIARTDDPNDSSSQHTTAATLWIHTPGGEDLPQIQFTTEEP